jgi:hypothetical protein
MRAHKHDANDQLLLEECAWRTQGNKLCTGRSRAVPVGMLPAGELRVATRRTWVILDQVLHLLAAQGLASDTECEHGACPQASKELVARRAPAARSTQGHLSHCMFRSCAVLCMPGTAAPRPGASHGGAAKGTATQQYKDPKVCR